MKLSIVSTLYQSAPYITEFHQRASTVAQQLVGEDYEIVLVNDGSPDDSLARAVALTAKDEHVIVVDLSRNFGHHQALVAGLSHIRGDYVFMIDSDMEEDPALLQEFWQVMKADPAIDVVYGIQRGQRKGAAFERISGRIFYSLFAWLSDMPYPANQLTARLMKRDYVLRVLEYQERTFDLWGLFSLAGFKQKAVPATKACKGGTTYTLSRKIAIAFEMISSFSTKPLSIIFLAGLAATVLSFLLIIYLLALRLLVNQPVSGWTSIVVSVWLIGGMILMSLGVLGLYISKIFLEVKQRPRYHVAKVYGGHDAGVNTTEAVTSMAQVGAQDRRSNGETII